MLWQKYLKDKMDEWIFLRAIEHLFDNEIFIRIKLYTTESWANKFIEIYTFNKLFFGRE